MDVDEVLCPSEEEWDNVYAEAGKQGGQEDAKDLTCKCPNYGEQSHEVAQCTNEKTKGRGKQGVYGMDDEEGEEAGVSKPR